MSLSIDISNYIS